ncbi:MAG: major facilitator superfamily domain-containing protein 9 [Actinobacteria bacterium]|nr:MAG: major facilitator superfamily domain-containing protein 9 [Actinomycetota bacterium]
MPTARVTPAGRHTVRDRRLAIIFAIVLVDMLSFSIVLPLLPYLAKDLGATPFQIGLLSAVYPIAQFFGAPILGRLSDRFGRKPVLIVSILGTLAGFVVLATAHSLWVLFISRTVDGLTGGNISVAQAYISDITTDESRGKALGLIGAAFGLGFILGPVTGGLLIGVNQSAPAWLGATLALANVVLVASLLPESLTEEDKRRLAARPHKGFDVSAFSAAVRHKRVGPLLLIRFGIGIAFGIFESGFALWAIAALDLSARTNAFVLAWVGILSVFVQAFLIGRLTRRWSDDGLLLTSLSVAAVALTAWGFIANLPLLIIAMPALSFGLAVSNTISTSALTKAVHRDEVGGILGISTSIQALTRIPAPIIAGALINYATVWSPGVTAGVLTGLCALFALFTLCWRPGARACDEPELAVEMGGPAGRAG